MSQCSLPCAHERKSRALLPDNQYIFSVGPKSFSYNISVEIKTENLDHFIVLMQEFLHVAKNLPVELASLVGVQD